MFFRKSATLPNATTAMPGRDKPIVTLGQHAVFARDMAAPAPEGVETILFGMGCFWGAERIFWRLGDGIWMTSVGYAGGLTPNPTYEETCSGATGHTEIVRVMYDPARLPLSRLLATFWENHDPTQGMRQGNDVGTQYRSALYWTDPSQEAEARASKAAYEAALRARGLGLITTELGPAGPFYPAELYHQQYLHKNPNGYCGIGGTGVSCPIGVAG